MREPLRSSGPVPDRRQSPPAPRRLGTWLVSAPSAPLVPPCRPSCAPACAQAMPDFLALPGRRRSTKRFFTIFLASLCQPLPCSPCNENHPKNRIMKIELQDSFNRTVISRHRTIRAAVQASRHHARAVERRYGASSYIPYSYRYSDGSRVCPDDVMDAEMELDQA